MTEENKKLVFAVEETTENLMTEIAAILPQLKTEWEAVQEENKRPYFVTEVNGVHVTVYERKAIFKISKGGLKEETRVIEKFVKKVPQKLAIYDKLIKRFKENEDHVFYKRVLRFMNGHITAEKAKYNHNAHFTEGDILRGLKDYLNDYLTEKNDIGLKEDRENN
jgi:hypothetical protein